MKPEKYCPYCGHNEFISGGWSWMNKEKTQKGKRYLCKNCKKRPYEHNLLDNPPWTPDQKQSTKYKKEYKDDNGREIEIEKDPNTIKASIRGVKSLEDFIEILNVDMKVWYVESWQAKDNWWDVNMKLKKLEKEGRRSYHEPHLATNYQFWIKAIFKRRVPIEDIDKFREQLLQDAKQVAARIELNNLPKKSSVPTDKNQLVYNPADLHLNKMAYEIVVGEKYDLKTGIKLLFLATEDLIAKSSPHKPEEIWFVLGNDYLHFDSAYPVPSTTKGTPQDYDQAWQRMFRCGRILAGEIINTLAQIAPVKVIIIQGNHDWQSAFYLGDCMEAFFHNTKHVTVENQPISRKYFQYGENMFAFEHGRKVNANELTTVMAQEQKKMWAATSFRYWYLADIHHEKKHITITTEDYHGVRIEFMPSLSGVDEWHHRKHYVGAIRAAKAFIHNYRDGRVAEFYHNRPPYK